MAIYDDILEHDQMTIQIKQQLQQFISKPQAFSIT